MDSGNMLKVTKAQEDTLDLTDDTVVADDPQQEKRFKIKKWYAVALWSWDVQTDDCSICRNFIMDPCIHCQSTKEGGKCEVVTGICNHSYHAHCISKWLPNRAVCPMDNTPWKEKTSVR